MGIYSGEFLITKSFDTTYCSVYKILYINTDTVLSLLQVDKNQVHYIKKYTSMSKVP